MQLNRDGLARAVKRLVPTVIFAAAVPAVAELLRFFAVKWLEPVGTAWTMPGFAQLHYHINTGASFGIFADYTAALSVFTALLIIFLFILSGSGFFTSRSQRMLVGLIAGGGIANLIERVFFGYVVDYIEFLFIDFAIFNFADCFVTVCSVLLILWIFVIDRSFTGDTKKKHK